MEEETRMSATATPDSQRRNIEVYFLAAPEDQAVCQDIIKFLKPIIRSSPIPIEVSTDFNIPGGADIEKYKQRLFEADIVLALISADFIDNDDVYNRNQKVIERYNRRETVMIPILVRNFMWKSTPFRSLPVVPKNLQPLNNKQFWNSPDDAVMAVVSDIYDSISKMTQAQSEAVQPLPAVEVASVPDLKAPSGTSIGQPEPDHAMDKPAQTQSEAVQPASVAEVESVPVNTPLETPISQPEPDHVMDKPAQTQSEAVQPPSVAEVKSVPELKAPSGTPISQTTSKPRESSAIAVDWRKKYYRTVLMKRAGAILLDHVILFVVLTIILTPFAGGSDAVFSSAFNWAFLILYFVIMPMMESSKWQGTIGKRILKLQITDREGERITFLRAFWRNIMRSAVLYSYILSFGIVLVIQYFRFNKTRKLFHDELSGTVIGEKLASSQAASVAVNAA
jgi:uncharacterized RDD family membrane protein YckC